MHGTKRDGERYRDEWLALAEKNRFLLVVPEFPRRDFPGANGYNLGNVFKNEGESINPRETWSYSAIEPLFDAVKTRFNNSSLGYAMYGHSAGAQFVHRFVFFSPDARVTQAVAANAGWYTLSSYQDVFPYGLKDTPVATSDLAKALGRNLTILLGTMDTDTQHRSLRTTPEAMAQGAHRFARGHHFYRQAENYARANRLAFNWRIEYAPQVGHKNGLMASFAAPMISEQFSEQALFIPATREKVDVLFLGDTSHGENYLERYEKNVLKQNGHNYSLENFSLLLNSADYVIANLETPLTDLRKPPYPGKAYYHYSDPEKASRSFASHNISAVSLANNHTLDYGMPGLTDTLESLGKAGIRYFGAGENQQTADAPLMESFELGDCTLDLAVFGRFEYRRNYAENFDFYATPAKGGASTLDIEKLTADIADLRRQHPNVLVVVYPHWGSNYAWRSGEQEQLARQLAAAGADLIIGHGSHTAGAVEYIGDTVVVYSIGNFVFNSRGRFDRYPQVLPMSLVAKLSGNREGSEVALDMHLYPIYSNNRHTGFQPRFVNDEEFHHAVNTILGKSKLSTRVTGNYDGFGSRFSFPVKSASCRQG